MIDQNLTSLAFPAYPQQEPLNHRMLQPGHPQHIRACIERLAAGLQVSRNVAEQNENQVTELLRLACEVCIDTDDKKLKPIKVRREVDCDTFYCTWRDCVKSFNRRDSLGKFPISEINLI